MFIYLNLHIINSVVGTKSSDLLSIWRVRKIRLSSFDVVTLSPDVLYISPSPQTSGFNKAQIDRFVLSFPNLYGKAFISSRIQMLIYITGVSKVQLCY